MIAMGHRNRWRTRWPNKAEEKTAETMAPAAAPQSNPQDENRQDEIVISCEQIPCSMQELEEQYKRWFEQYLGIPQPALGIYVPEQGSIRVQPFTEVYPPSGGFVHCIFKGLKKYSFFPGTKVSKSRRFVVDTDAILNDW